MKDSMLRFGIAVFIAMILGGICGNAQNQNEGVHHVVQDGEIHTPRIELNGRYFKEYLGDIQGIVASPVHWNSSQWFEATIFTGITATLYPLDSETKEEAQESRNSLNDKMSRIFRSFGEPQYTAVPLGALYLYGHFQDNERARETALLGLESLVLSGATTEVIKNLTHRVRPYSGHANNVWHGPEMSLGDLSFPSGHSTQAFALATVIANEYRDKKYMPPLVYGIASMTALSRVHDNAHWFSDVFFGSAIGYFTAEAVLNRHRVGKTSIYPAMNGNRLYL
jgi:hypothetical protein